MKINRKNDPFVKMANLYQQINVQCKCGHKEIFPHWVDKKICSWCGNYIYKNKKVEFKEKLAKAIIKYKEVKK